MRGKCDLSGYMVWQRRVWVVFVWIYAMQAVEWWLNSGWLT